MFTDISDVEILSLSFIDQKTENVLYVQDEFKLDSLEWNGENREKALKWMNDTIAKSVKENFKSNFLYNSGVFGGCANFIGGFIENNWNKTKNYRGVYKREPRTPLDMLVFNRTIEKYIDPKQIKLISQNDILHKMSFKYHHKNCVFKTENNDNWRIK